MTRRFTDAERKTIWDLRDAGVPVKRIARHLGRQNSSLRRFIADAGGSARNHENALSCGCRWRNARRSPRGLAAGLSIRAIATELGRAPSTICREVNTNGGRRRFRALVADRAADRRGLRPKATKFARCPRLRATVERKLEATWSPEQIAAWLADTYADNPEMQVSHETIYQSLRLSRVIPTSAAPHAPCIRRF